jgi:outer membrane protein assembly factor BamB
VAVVGLLLVLNPGKRLFDRAPDVHFSETPPSYPTVHFSKTEASARPALSQYRGDERKWGQVAEVPSFNFKLKWKIAPFNVGIHTASKASATVDETGIYIGSDAAWFFKFDFEGNQVWDVFVGDAFRGIHSTALLDPENVYFGAYNGSFYCLDKKTGKLKYVKKLGDAIGASPTMLDGFIYVSVETFPADGFVAKIRASDGELIWRSPWLGDQSHSTPTIDRESKTVIVGGNKQIITGFDLETGKKKWSLEIDGAIKGVGPLVEGHVLYGAKDHFLYSVNAATGELKYKQDLGAPIVSSITYDSESGIGFVGAGKSLIAFQASDGSVVWKKILAFQENVLMQASGVLLKTERNQKGLLTACGDVDLCVYDVKNGEVLKRIKTDGLFTATPVVFQNTMYAAMNKDAGFWAFEVE